MMLREYYSTFLLSARLPHMQMRHRGQKGVSGVYCGLWEICRNIYSLSSLVIAGGSWSLIIMLQFSDCRSILIIVSASLSNRGAVPVLPSIALAYVAAKRLPHQIADQLNQIQKRGCGARSAIFCTTLTALIDQWIKAGKSGTIWQPSLPISQGGSSAVRRRDEAILVFLKFLGSPTRTRLSRCDDCLSYIVRSRAPGRNIRHGSFCKSCKSTGRAGMKRMKDTRERRRKELVKLAARWWPKWSRSGHLNQSQWVAEMMAGSLPDWRKTKGISGNWVTRHSKEIEAEIKRRNSSHG
jgi:hypothetical protein